MSKFRPVRASSPSRGLLYQPHFVAATERAEVLAFLLDLHPIWEQRFSLHNPPPVGQSQRWLLRPVYWLGNWQFACLNYYHPPKGVHNRCVAAEAYPPALARLVKRIENLTRERIPAADLPPQWELNTCLVNYYGCRIVDGKKIDVARVGEHRDFEPGPVGSISFGERALIQFVDSKRRDQPSQVVTQQWLEDCSLQVFAGERWKNQLFHRVQRVEKKQGVLFPIHQSDFETRRINLTFRYVPKAHILPLNQFPKPLQSDVAPYVQQLGKHSRFWQKQEPAGQ